MLTHFLPHRVEIELIFALRVAVSGTISFKIAIFGHETWNLKKSAGSCIWTIFLPHWVEIELIFGLRTAVFEIEEFKVLISVIYDEYLGNPDYMYVYVFLPERGDVLHCNV